jgi:hypothetical protein
MSTASAAALFSHEKRGGIDDEDALDTGKNSET